MVFAGQMKVTALPASGIALVGILKFLHKEEIHAGRYL